ncbi:MAG: hypothetical protein GY801_28670 [bacterium]|nr:hypothetical protein [bacterium]
MYKNMLRKSLLLLGLLAISMMLLSCSSSSNNDTDGLIHNKASYRTHVNFHGVKIVEVLPGQLLGEYDLKKGNTYLFQVTVFDGDKVLQVIDSSIYISSSTSSYEINGQTCHWYIQITGNTTPFRVNSAS